MPTEPFVETNHLQAKFLSKALCSKIRVDGRNYTDVRIPVLSSIITKKDSVSVEVSLGLTRAFTVIRFSIGEPLNDKPKEGIFSLKFSLFPSKIEKLTQADYSVVAYNQRLLETIYKFSRVLDLEKLCIVPGEKVWILNTKVILLDNSDGNGISCSAYSLLSALLVAETAYRSRGTSAVIPPISLFYTPVLLQFAILRINNDLINVENYLDKPFIAIDPVLLEEEQSAGNAIMAIDPFTKEIFSFFKRGDAIRSFDLTDFIGMNAITAARTILNALKKQLEAIS